MGKYNVPKEEERIFLFLDLRSSTSLAEQLGHVKFSCLLQDCFFDLSDVVITHRVDIYQYVGDEAVLSWHKDVGIQDNRCIKVYYDFLDVLNSKSDYYIETYGVVPFFKAGLHVGKVIVAEVGVVKKEIAYHGDVLNTTARIQGQCNRLEQGLLASEHIINLLHDKSDFKHEFLGEHSLRGKQGNINLYSCTPV